jgi:hypothetical protein
MTRRGVIAAVTLLVAALAPGARAAGVADDVRDVRKALVATHLSGPDRARCLGAPAALRMEAKRLGGQREREMLAVLASSAEIARRIGYDTPRALNVCRELTFNRSFLAGNELPRDYGHVFSDGIIYERYPGQGMRIMPLATFEKADALARGGRTEEFLQAVDAAIGIAAERSGRYELEYLMPFSGLRPPMRSAMSAGTAIMAVVRAYDATGDVKYLDAGWHFAQEVLALGDSDGNEIWFRHYHEAPWLRVLNSDLRTTYGLGFLVEATGDAELTAVYQRSLATILKRLPEYDTGAWSRYSQTRDANLNYHDVQTQLLKYLYWQTKDVRFDQWWAKFKAYRAAPAQVGLGGGTPVAYPTPLDGFRDTVDVPVVLSKPSRVTLTFRRPDGTTAGQKVFANLPTGRSVLAWDPQAGLPAGDYTVDVRVVDLTNLVTTSPAITTVTVARDVTPPRIVSLGAYKRRLQWRVIDTETPYITLVVKLKGGRTVRLERMPLKGWYRMPKRAVGALVRVIDTSGNATEQRAG